jgi:uncharacterized protein (TIGR00369 family)
MSLDANPTSPAHPATEITADARVDPTTGTAEPARSHTEVNPTGAADPTHSSTEPVRSQTQVNPTTGTPERARSYTWSDPTVTAGAVATTSGLEILQGMLDGRFPPPPIAETLQIYPVEFTAGRIVFEMTPQEWHYNPIGSVHGGVLSTLVDSALGCAVHSRLPAGVGYTSLELKVNFVRPVTLTTGTIRCEGTLLSLGRRAATAEAKVTTTTGKLVAHATTTCMLFPLGE